jgi:hypothetical protein
VEFKDNSSNCVVIATISVITPSTVGKPIFSVFCTNTTPCIGSAFSLNQVNGQTWPWLGGPVSYTIIAPGASSNLPTGTLSFTNTGTFTTCGNYEIVTRDNVFLCISSYDVAINCSTNAVTPITIAGNTTLCIGSSITLSATAAATATWILTPPTPSVASGSTINFSPALNSTITVNGINANGCASSASLAIGVNTNCAYVWPGDANSDGAVSSSDVLELGYYFNSTGSARTPTSNGWTSQFASIWSGTVSTGKNRCHADCNGDGVINGNDLLAIGANFLLTHSFKSSTQAINGDINLVSQQSTLNAGSWNKIDVLLGSNTNTINQIYGLTFELNYDPSIIQQDSTYLVYAPSFLNASNQNVEFQKGFYTPGKIYAASVRVDGNNVSGNGKIAELYVKPKLGLAPGTLLNLSVSNANKVNRSASSSTISGGSIAIPVDGNALGIHKNWLPKIADIFPNPSNGFINLASNSSQPVAFSIIDLSGRTLMTGEFTTAHEINLSHLEKGSYLIRFEADNVISCKKLIIE